ncbi:MAG TPA: glycosyltransferase, partial [Burkholderiales bacterium]
AYHTLAHSILRRASIPVTIAPVMQSQLKDIYTRGRGPTESTEFSLTRFLVPALSQYRGWSLFMDCDMLCRADIAELAAYAERAPDKAVLVCKHDYTPGPKRKFLNQVQTVYPRKNWSSVMLFNNARCTALTADYVNKATGLELQRFQWLRDEEIGELPLEWNWLVGEYKRNADARIVHFTIGGPYFEEYRGCDYAEEWFEENRRMNHAENRIPA